MIETLALNQNWAKLTPWLGIISTILLFSYTNIHEPIFWALVNIPFYLFHQTEEHYIPGGFKNFVNRKILKLPENQESLTDIKIFWVNILLVWLAFAIFGALSFINIGFGLVLIAFSAINCFLHIIQVIHYRAWNPGSFIASFQFIGCIYAGYFITKSDSLTNPISWWIGVIIFSVVSHIIMIKKVKQ